MPAIRIRVGASLDTSATTVFVPVVEAARKARAQIQNELSAAGKALGAGPYRTNAKQAGDAIVAVGSSAKKTGAIIGTVNADAAKSFAMLSASAKKLPAELATVAREAERELRKIERANARMALGLAKPANDTGGGPNGRRLRWGSIRVGDGASIGVSAGLAAGVGLTRSSLNFARGMARSFGIETDPGQHIQQSLRLETAATNLSNAGYMPGTAGPNGQRVDPEDLIKQTRHVGMLSAMSSEDVMGGLSSFVGKTGDLQTGRDVLADLAKLSKATGTEMEHMVAAAGDVSNQLGDIPDKGEAIVRVMRTVAGQGKLGAVEIKDMASQMAKVASVAGSFEGKAEDNIATLGALAQMARQRGGAATANQAATSAAAFARDIVKPTNVKNWNKAGIGVFTDESKTQVRKPEELIMEALSKTGGNLEKLAKLFPNAMSMRAVRGFANVYNETGGSNADKLEAVNEEFKRLRDTMMGGGEIQRSYNEAMATGESQMQLLNNRFAEVGDEVKGALLPAIVELAPAFIDVTKGFVDALAFLNGTQDVAGDKFADKALHNVSRDSNVLAGMTYKATPNQFLTPEQQLADVQKNRDAIAPFMKKSAEDEAAMQNAIEGQKKRVASAGNHGDLLGYGTTGTLSDMSKDEVQKIAAGGGSGAGFAKDFLAQQQKLVFMQEAAAQLQRDKDATLAGILKGELKVRVMNPPDPPKPKPPASGDAD